MRVNIYIHARNDAVAIRSASCSPRIMSRIRLWNHITESYDVIILRNHISDLDHRIYYRVELRKRITEIVLWYYFTASCYRLILRKCTKELCYRIGLWNYITELYHRFILRNDITE